MTFALPATLEPLHTGRVRWFNDALGYGFIRHQDQRDVFVHFSSFETPPSGSWRTLRAGTKVAYTVEETALGLRARQVWIQL